jgi:hypothetical protein
MQGQLVPAPQNPEAGVTRLERSDTLGAVCGALITRNPPAMLEPTSEGADPAQRRAAVGAGEILRVEPKQGSHRYRGLALSGRLS